MVWTCAALVAGRRGALFPGALSVRRDGVLGSWDPTQYELLAAPGFVDSVRHGVSWQQL